MAKKIKWSAHRSDKKIGTIEVIEDDHLAQRYVDGGMATYADEPAAAPKPPSSVKVPDPKPATP